MHTTETIDIPYIKDKFSTLLSKLVTNARLSYSDITYRFIKSDFLDCFENNNLSYFFDKSYEAIIQDLFNKESVYSEDIDPVIYWCGIQYMNIFLNKRIPLKQLFLMCPLRKMESYYEMYHEQNDIKLVNVFMNELYQKSILKELRNDKRYSIRELSILTGISPNTLKYYEDNKNLFKASFENVNKLRKVLECSDSLMKEKSDFVPYTNVILETKETKQNFDKYVKNYYNSDNRIIYEDDSYYQEGRTKRLVTKDVRDSAILYTIDQYNDDKLLF